MNKQLDKLINTKFNTAKKLSTASEQYKRLISALMIEIDGSFIQSEYDQHFLTDFFKIKQVVNPTRMKYIKIENRKETRCLFS